MKRREFIKDTATYSSLAFMSSTMKNMSAKDTLRTAHIGVGNMGLEDLNFMSSHPSVKVTALCDVDSNYLAAASELFPDAKVYADYRVMLRELKADIDAVVVSTPDHTHAPASMMAMEFGKQVYCQKPLTHHVSEARAMKEMAEKNNLITQMGIQVHSFYDYKLATQLIRAGIIGKVKAVHAWSPKNWGFDGKEPKGSDPIPESLDWNLWLGTSAERPYKEAVYHPGNWRKLLDYGCGTLGDMGVHIFDTPYNALDLDIPFTIKNNCRKPNGFGFPENNEVVYEFPGTAYTSKKFKWYWYDGVGAPAKHKDLILPNKGTLPDQGAMFVGETGRLLLPHFMQLPWHIIEDKKYNVSRYKKIDLEKYIDVSKLEEPIRDYDLEGKNHYHEFVDACLGKATCSAPFSYAARLTETILLGVIASRFPGKTLHWNKDTQSFKEKEANKFLDAPYREF